MKKEKIKRKTINLDGEKIYLDICRYESNNRLAIIAHTKNEFFCDVTINLPEVESLETEMLVAIDTICKHSGLEKKLIDAKIIDGIINRVQYNFETYDIAVLNLERLYVYDPEGFEKELGNIFLIAGEEMEAE